MPSSSRPGVTGSSSTLASRWKGWTGRSPTWVFPSTPSGRSSSPTSMRITRGEQGPWLVPSEYPSLRHPAAAAGPALAMTPVVGFETARPFAVGAMEIEAFPVSHDAADPVGFSITAAGKNLLIATDLGTADEVLDPHLARADLVILESNYDLGLLHVSRYPWFVKNRILSARGHLSNDEAARALARTAGRHRVICLAHLSEVNNLAPLARDTVWDALRRAKGSVGPVLVIPPNGRSGVITVG